MITEFQTWHKGDIPDRDGWIVEGNSGDYLEALYHCDTWEEATAQAAEFLKGEDRNVKLYFRDWR